MCWWSDYCLSVTGGKVLPIHKAVFCLIQLCSRFLSFRLRHSCLSKCVRNAIRFWLICTWNDNVWGLLSWKKGYITNNLLKCQGEEHHWWCSIYEMVTILISKSVKMSYIIQIVYKETSSTLKMKALKNITVKKRLQEIASKNSTWSLFGLNNSLNFLRVDAYGVIVWGKCLSLVI